MYWYVLASYIWVLLKGVKGIRLIIMTKQGYGVRCTVLIPRNLDKPAMDFTLVFIGP